MNFLIPLPVQSFYACHYGNQLGPVQRHSIDFRWHVHAVMTPNEPSQLSRQTLMDMSSMWHRLYVELLTLQGIGHRNTSTKMGKLMNFSIWQRAMIAYNQQTKTTFKWCISQRWYKVIAAIYNARLLKSKFGRFHIKQM